MKGIILISIVVFALLISVSAKKGKSSKTSSSAPISIVSAPTSYSYDESRLFYDGYGYGAMDQYIQTVYKYYGVGHGYRQGGSGYGDEGYESQRYGQGVGEGRQGGSGYGDEGYESQRYGQGVGRQGGSGYGGGYQYGH
eukprot:TRINITY_DN75_c0_g1_i3.p1 TRINITY_DN75_c0_g1~~TRINITY_DN75_c0_g1_i3.p1  ORF type:complete len:139 (-),score=22.09 TRINITY_DN75_c0_g1_i3:69-485(-)